VNSAARHSVAITIVIAWPGRRPCQGRRLPLHQISVERMAGLDASTRRGSGAVEPRRSSATRSSTRTSRLGRPVGNHYPTFALVRPTGFAPVPPRWQRGMRLPHPGRTWTGDVHRPSTSVSFQRTRSCELLPLVPPVLAAAPGFEPGPARFGGSDASVTPRCRRHVIDRPFRKTEPPCDLARSLLGFQTKTKKAF
jgi:hypothetical protein